MIKLNRLKIWDMEVKDYITYNNKINLLVLYQIQENTVRWFYLTDWTYIEKEYIEWLINNQKELTKLETLYNNL